MMGRAAFDFLGSIASGLKAQVLWSVGLHSNPDSTFSSFVVFSMVFNLSELQFSYILHAINTEGYYIRIK